MRQPLAPALHDAASSLVARHPWDCCDCETNALSLAAADTFIQKTKRLYLDTRTQRNMGKLNDDLAEVHSIMTRNIAEVLGQGQKLDGMMQMSSLLSQESKHYSARSKDIYRQALIRKYMPIGVVVGVVLLVLWFRSFF